MNRHPMRFCGIAEESALVVDEGGFAVQADAAIAVPCLNEAVRAELPVFGGLLRKGRPLLANAG